MAGRRRVELGGGGTGGSGTAEAHQLATDSLDGAGSSSIDEGPLAAIRAFFLPRHALGRLPLGDRSRLPHPLRMRCRWPAA